MVAEIIFLDKIVYMTIFDFALLFLSSFGLVWTIVYAEILDILGIRQIIEKSEFFKSLTHCSFCTGFWVGVLYTAPLFLSYFISPTLFHVVSLPFCTASICYILDKITCLFEDLSLYFKK